MVFNYFPKALINTGSKAGAGGWGKGCLQKECRRGNVQKQTWMEELRAWELG